MEEERRKTTEERIKEIQTQIISNSKDAKWAKDLVHELLRLQKQDDDMNKEIDVPISEVLETVSFGATEVSKTIRGYLFKSTYHSGLWTFIGSNFGNVCDMLQLAMDSQKVIDEKRDWAGCQELVDDVQFIFQAPLFAAMGWSLPMIGEEADTKSLINISNAIRAEINRFNEEHGNPTEPRQETEEDIKANNEMEALGRVVENLANTPLPPEDTEYR